MTEENLARVEQLIKIAESGLAEGSMVSSLEAQISAIVELSKLNHSLADDYVLKLQIFKSHTDPNQNNPDCYLEIFEYPNARGLLGEDLKYGVYVNDTAPSPDAWGKLRDNKSGKIIEQCISRIKQRKKSG